MADDVDQLRARVAELERQLAAANARFHSIVENNADGLIIVDADGIVRFVSPAAEGIFERSASELLGTELGFPLVAGESTELDILRPGGRTIAVELRVATTEWDGRAACVASLRDTTERKRMEAERRELEAQVRRAQRVEMAGRVASQVAHDFNNLLQPLVGYPGLIKRRLPANHPAIAYCDAMIRLAQQLGKINGDLLTLGRRGHFERAPTDLNQVAEQAVTELGKRRDVGRIALRLAPDLPAVSGAEAQLLRVVTNLVANSLDATSGGGEVVVETARVSVEQPTGHYNRIEPGEYARLVVKDSGDGIAPEILGQIFDAFFTTKRADLERGSGLGLTVVQAVVEDHHGTIDVESEPGQGATFSVYLPIE